jgi:hypothetical protein
MLKKILNVALDKHLKKKYGPRGSKGCRPLLYRKKNQHAQGLCSVRTSEPEYLDGPVSTGPAVPRPPRISSTRFAR